MKPRKVLVTGAAGFIGYHVSNTLLKSGYEVVGLDNLSDYYDVELKKARLSLLSDQDSFKFLKQDVSEEAKMDKLFRDEEFDAVVHLAAQAGVRHSLNHPFVYIDSNLKGFTAILEGCRHTEVDHLVFASSSSVYGANTRQPFSEKHSVDHPVSLYGATKKANEVMAHSYARLFGVSVTGLRFFTVYGPWGRPDMALFRFAEGILQGRPIDVYNHGDMWRDFTYVDDVVEGIVRVLEKPAKPARTWSSEDPDPARSSAPFRVYNVGCGQPVRLTDFIDAIEDVLGMESQRNLLPMQPGDVKSTFADTSGLEEAVGYRPQVSVEEGVRETLNWYLQFYHEDSSHAEVLVNASSQG